MRRPALLLLCSVTALLSGAGCYWAGPEGRIVLWMQGLFLVSALLTLVLLLAVVVSVARASIESSVHDSVPVDGDSASDDAGVGSHAHDGQRRR